MSVAQTTTIRPQVDRTLEAGLCKCGCGQPTRLGKVAVLSEGRTRAEIAKELGMTTAHVKSVLRSPPQYIKGHSRGLETVARLKAKATFAERRIPRLYDYVRAVDTRQRYMKGDRRRIAEGKSKALSEALRAFDLRSFAAQSIQPLDVRAALLVRAIRGEIVRAYTPCELDPTIEWLRAQVGVGWKRDKLYDPRWLSLEGMDFRAEAGRSGDKAWWEDKRAVDPQELLEQQIEQSVAAQMVASGDPLVARALALPESLTESERQHLSEIFSVMERAELVGDVPKLSPSRYRAQGGGINHGFGSTKTRAQRVAHAQMKRATGRSGHPSRQPPQKYRQVVM